MRIDAQVPTPPFSRPLATYDSSAPSFADFLDEAEAQRMSQSAPVAFGARGLFGAAAAESREAVSGDAGPSGGPSGVAPSASSVRPSPVQARPLDPAVLASWAGGQEEPGAAEVGGAAALVSKLAAAPIPGPALSVDTAVQAPFAPRPAEPAEAGGGAHGVDDLRQPGTGSPRAAADKGVELFLTSDGEGFAVSAWGDDLTSEDGAALTAAIAELFARQGLVLSGVRINGVAGEKTR